MKSYKQDLKRVKHIKLNSQVWQEGNQQNKPKTLIQGIQDARLKRLGKVTNNIYRNEMAYDEDYDQQRQIVDYE